MCSTIGGTTKNKPELKMQDSPVSNTNTIDDQPTKDLFGFIPQGHSANFGWGYSAFYPKHKAWITKKNSLPTE